MLFNLTLVFPNERMHGLYGYAEVMETIRWGLTELGHQVTTRQNRGVVDAVNIVFGHQMLDEATINALPENSIIYNLEQIADAPAHQMKPSYRAAAARLQVWDYSSRNVAAWQQLKPVRPPVHVPIGWSPTISCIAPREQDIDVLLYGSPSEPRLRAIAEIADASAKVVYVCGLYGAARDDLIARSKIVLNMNRYATRVFEVVRVSYLLANGKAVVSDIYPESDVDPDFREAIAFVPVQNIPATCLRILSSDAERRHLEEKGPDVMRRRDIRMILQRALAEHGLK